MRDVIVRRTGRAAADRNQTERELRRTNRYPAEHRTAHGRDRNCSALRGNCAREGDADRARQFGDGDSMISDPDPATIRLIPDTAATICLSRVVVTVSAR